MGQPAARKTDPIGSHGGGGGSSPGGAAAASVTSAALGSGTLTGSAIAAIIASGMPSLRGSGGCSKASSGSDNVFIEGQAAARAGADDNDHGSSHICEGSSSVLVNGKPLARVQDKTHCHGKIVSGASKTIVGGGTTHICKARVQIAANDTGTMSDVAGGALASAITGGAMVGASSGGEAGGALTGATAGAQIGAPSGDRRNDDATSGPALAVGASGRGQSEFAVRLYGGMTEEQLSSRHVVQGMRQEGGYGDNSQRILNQELADPENRTLRERLQRFGDERRAIDPYNDSSFGRYRESYAEAWTPMREDGRYGAAGQEVVRQLDASGRSGGTLQTSAVLDGRTYPLSTYVSRIGDDAPREVTYDMSNSSVEAPGIRHTDPATASRVVDALEPRYQALVNGQVPQSEVMARVGEIHYWTAQAMPFERGSASVSDWNARYLMERNGIVAGSPTTPLDLRAMTTTPQEFIGTYASQYSSVRTVDGAPVVSQTPPELTAPVVQPRLGQMRLGERLGPTPSVTAEPATCPCQGAPPSASSVAEGSASESMLGRAAGLAGRVGSGLGRVMGPMGYGLMVIENYRTMKNIMDGMIDGKPNPDYKPPEA